MTTKKEFGTAQGITDNTKNNKLKMPKSVVEGVQGAIKDNKIGYKDIKNIYQKQRNDSDVSDARLTVVTTPIIKAYIKHVGTNRGRNNGGTRALIDEMALEYMKNHPETLEGFQYRD